jgi:hypothetical protein
MESQLTGIPGTPEAPPESRTEDHSSSEDEGGSRSSNDPHRESTLSHTSRRIEEDGSGMYRMESGSYTLDARQSAQSTNANNGEDTRGVKSGCLYRVISRFPRLHNVLLSWPRTCSLILGVILPLFVLIFIAVIVGIVLAIVEAPLEVGANNEVIATDIQTYDGLMLISAPLFSEQYAFLPSVCLDLYLRKQSPSLIEQYVLDVLQSEEKALKALNMTDPFAMNQSSVGDYLEQCGEFAQPIVDRMQTINETFFSVVGNAMTFNWIRCIPGAKGLRTVAGMASLDMIPYMRYDAQKKYFIETWEKDRKRLYNIFYRELIAANMSSVNASTLALQKSIKEASGVDGCELNAPASGS